jgi:MYXO-CTERM domain-containing protein
MTQRWLGFWLVLLIVGFGSRLASAQVTTAPTGVIVTTATPVNTASAATSVSVSATANPNVDMVVTGTCTGAGAGTFAVSPPTAKLTASFSVTFTPTARGPRQCTISVRNANATFGTGTEVGTFDVSGSGLSPVVGVSPPSYDYMGVRELDTAAPNPSVKSQVFTISNSGDTGQSLSVNSITFSGTNPSDFAVTATPGAYPFSIGPTASAQWTVTFNPGGTGMRSATMTIATNDPSTPMKTVTVQGSGTAALIDLSDVTFSMVNHSQGAPSATSSSTLSNTAATNTGSLTAYSATIAPTTSGNTWFKFGTGLGCAAGTTSCTFTAGTSAPTSKSIPVQCAPPSTASGTETATLTVASDTDPGGANTATLTCTAVRPDIAVDVSMLDFMAQNVNMASGAKTVTVTNNGSTALSFYFTRVGTDLAMFSASTGTGCGASAANPCSLAPTASVGIDVVFTPTSTGTKSATLAITNNDPDLNDSPKNVTLAGSGVAPLIAVSPTSIPFTNVEVGKTGSGTLVTVTNNGSANLTIDSATLFAGATDYVITAGLTGSQMVAPMASVTWTLACKPSSQGLKNGTFRIVSNSGFGAAKVNSDVTMTCTGDRGVLTITPTFYNFMGVREGDSVPQNFTLQNTGNVTVSNINYVLDAKLLGFAVTSPTFPTMLTAGQSVTVTVTFAPVNSTYGCAVVNGGDCAITFTGGWGTTPTATMTTLVVIGQGLKADYDTYPASPNALDLGSVRWDKTVTMAVNVINTGGSPLGIKGLSITPGTALAGELSVASCSHNSVVVPCPTMAAPFNSSGMNDTLVLNVTCDPADRVAMIDGTLTVSSDLNTATPNRTVPLKCTSTTATLALTPSTMVLDFGATDLDASPVAVTKRITLANTGTATLDVGAGATSGAGLARFAFTSVSARPVVPGTPFDVDVTYTPLAEKPPNAPDVASLTFPLAGHLGGPTSMTIQITGYGADRHVGVSPAPTFPDTFKNPGDVAPVMPVTITNTGYAPLDVTAVMLDNDPIWTLDNPDPVVIPAASSHDFMVRFQPLMAGKAPTGHLAIMNNDNEVGKALVQVDLEGNGLNRNVAMGPRVIPLGFTGIGIPIRLSELAPNDPLVGENADLGNSFNIATIKVDSIVGADGTFEIVDAKGNEPSDVPLDPGGTHSFDITFTPNEVGDFEATATLYLDQDPTPQAQVTLRGRGLYVDARGGGGCSTGGGKTSGWLALALGALVAARRRRRSAAVLGLGIVATLAGTVTESAAQSSRNLNLNVFEPTPATVGTTFHAQSATVAEDGAWAASALLTYANNALVLDTSQNDDAAIKNRTMLLLGGAYVFGGSFEASARIPVLMQSGDPAGDPLMRFGVDPASGASLGDATLQVKAAIGERDAIGGTLAYGASLAFTLPTGTGDEFSGNDLPTVHALGLASFSRGRVTTTFNLGGVVREKAAFANITQGPGIVWAAGASFRALNQLWVGGELFGDLVPGGKRTMAGNDVLLDTIEGLAGVHYRIARPMDLGIAVGRGVTTGPGTPAVRGIVTFSYTPGATELKPIHPPRAPEPAKDTDSDGVTDSLDECPLDVEDKDGFRDDDGCPDPDNDNDGHPDLSDGCPAEAEDRDHFQDEDGCPDLDNDEDGVADGKDKCPLAAEDKDGFADGDGCPDPDNDRDGILDAADKCPKEAEVINGTTDDDGCPDKGNSLVVLSPDRIELLESIPFSGSRISRSGNNLLGQLGATLRAHPEILRVRLTVHVQPTRNAATDQKLSEARAKSVRDWLVNYGIDGQRLQSSGFGGEKPLVPPTSRGAQQINDRLELIILERK